MMGDKMNIGYLIDVKLGDNPVTYIMFVDTAEELARLQQDIEMGGFGIGCDTGSANRIKYVSEE